MWPKLLSSESEESIKSGRSKTKPILSELTAYQIYYATTTFIMISIIEELSCPLHIVDKYINTKLKLVGLLNSKFAIKIGSTYE